MIKEKARTRKRGFTLIELMMGVSLCSIALFGTMLIIGQSLAMGGFTGNRAIAMNEMRQVVEESGRVTDNDGVATMVSTNWTNWATQNLNNTLENQSVAVTNSAGGTLLNNANPLPIRITINWTEKGKATVYSVDTMVTQR